MKIAQSCPTLRNPTDYTVHGLLQARILEWVAFPFSRGSSQPRDQTQVSHIADRFFTSWATREAQILEWVSLSLLQQIFPTQESNRGLLHCRRILYQLSYQGSLPPCEPFHNCLFDDWCPYSTHVFQRVRLPSCCLSISWIWREMTETGGWVFGDKTKWQVSFQTLSNSEDFQSNYRMPPFCKWPLVWLLHGLVLLVQKATPGLDVLTH